MYIQSCMLLNFTKLSSNVKFAPWIYKKYDYIALLQVQVASCVYQIYAPKLFVFAGCIPAIQQMVCVWGGEGACMHHLFKKKQHILSLKNWRHAYFPFLFRHYFQYSLTSCYLYITLCMHTCIISVNRLNLLFVISAFCEMKILEVNGALSNTCIIYTFSRHI